MKKTRRGRKVYMINGQQLSGSLAHYINFTAAKKAGINIDEEAKIKDGQKTIARRINGNN